MKIRNRMTDPWPNSPCLWTQFNGTPSDLNMNMAADNSAMQLDCLTDTRNSICAEIDLPAAGEYVAGLRVLGAAVTMRIKSKGGSSGVLVQKACAQGNHAVRFTTPNNGMQFIIDIQGKGTSSLVKGFVVMSLADWQAMRSTSEQIVWFAPPKNGVSMQKYTPTLLTGGGAHSNPACRYPHWVVVA